MPSLRIYLFGSPRVERNGRPVSLQRRKTVALLAYLVVTNQPHSRDSLATLLWSEDDHTAARANLRRELSRLREEIGNDALLIDRTQVQINPQAGLWLDVAAYNQNLDAARQHDHPAATLCPQCLQTLTEAAELYQGDFMAGFSLPGSLEFDRWQFFQTESLSQSLAGILQQLILWHTGQGEFEQGIHFGRRWLDLDPLHEPAHRQLMQLYAWSGQHAAALRQYQECARLLQDELGVSPETATTGLHELIRARHLPPPAGIELTPPPPPATASEPNPADRYRIEAFLAVGGHGEVYRGQDRVTGRPVVIKRLRPELVKSDRGFLARFAREGELLRQLDHPNIVKMLAMFDQDGQHNIVMEYAPGGTLRQLLERQPQLPLPQALNIALELADALGRAHHLNVIHRDLKPENVLLAADGSPRLTDFGMARLLREDSQITHTGLLMGSPAYMSPEALHGEELDPRSDVWSFGVLLYEMIAGRRPFDGEQITPILVHILNDPMPEIGQFRPDVPPQLAELLRQMLVKERDGRPASMRLIAAQLEALRDGRSLPPALSTPGSTPPPAERPAPITTPAASLTPTGRRRSQQIRYCVSSDGVRIAYATVGEGPVFVKAANWLSHLEYDWESPVWRHWLDALSQNHTLIRYDERGCGLSDWDAPELSVDAYVRDLEAVVDTLGLERFPLLGISQGGPVALTYAVRHPERVSHLILYGTYATGRFARTDLPGEAEQAETILQLIRLGWGQDNPAFRQFFTTLFMPEATAEQMHWFNELQRRSTSPEMAYRLEESFFKIDVRPLLPQVMTPTLVLHAPDDAVVPFQSGRYLATHIPNAHFVTLESKNHILLESEPAWQRFLAEVFTFIGANPPAYTPGGRTPHEPPAEPPPAPVVVPQPPPPSPPAPPPSPQRPTPNQPLQNLPPQVTPFVGRHQELQDIQQLLLENQSCRLVTLVGPGGIGKTRLALAVAEAVSPTFRDGVCFVPLAPLATADHLLATLADSLDFQFYGPADPRQQLLNYLQPKNLLLVMDNFEHVLAGARLVTDILQVAPNVKILATSREQLYLTGETLYPLAGMAYPEWDSPPAGWTKTQASAYDAMKLLQQRAQLMRGDYPLPAGELAAMARICRLVQGMPLALLLASSWLSVLSFAEIASEIEQSLDFLEGDLLDLPERQRSMRAVFDYSWKQLSADEQRAFRNLSVFRGGFTRQAAQEVAGANLRALRTLAAKSLLALTRRSEGQGERYEIHELLRQFGEEALEKSGEAAATRGRHSNYYLAFLRDREAGVKGGDQLATLREIETDIENIRIAWDWALARQNLTALDHALECFHLYFDMSARQSEGSALFAATYSQLVAAGFDDTHPLLARLLTRACFLGMFFSDVTDSSLIEKPLQHCLEVAQQQANPAEEALCLGALGSYYNLATLEVEKALPLLEQCYHLFSTVGDHFFISRSLHWLGMCQLHRGSVDKFYEITWHGVEIARNNGNKVDVTYSLGNMGEAALLQGDYQSAEKYLQEAAATAQEMELHVAIAYVRMLHALFHALLGDLSTGQELIERAHRRATDLNYTILVAFVTSVRALLAGLTGDNKLARQLGEEALAITGNHGLGLILANWAIALAACNQRDVGAARPAIRAALEEAYRGHYPAALVWLLPVAALVLAHQDQAERAVELLSLAQTHPLALSGWLSHWPLLATSQSNLQAELGSEPFAAAWDRGLALPLEPTIEHLLTALQP